MVTESKMSSKSWKDLTTILRKDERFWWKIWQRKTSGFFHEGKEKSDSVVTDKNKNKFVNNCFKCFFNVKPFTPFKVSRKWC